MSISTKLMFVLQIIFMFFWGMQLFYTDSFYCNYLLLLIISSICCYINISSVKGSQNNYLTNIFAFLFSGIIALAEYNIWDFLYIPKDFGVVFYFCFKLLMILIFLVGGYFVFWNILNIVVLNINKINQKQSMDESLNAKRIFWYSFIILVFTRLIILWFSYYPGILTANSIYQVHQILSEDYTNHHPYWHTQIIEFFIILGIKFFNDIHAGLAMYSIFSILFTSICFSFAADTMVKMNVSKTIIVSSMLFYYLMPYHILCSITMFKDTFWGCCILLFIIFIYRFMENIGNRYLNYFIIAFSAFGIYIFRNNGFFVLILLALLFVLIWKLKYKIMLLIFGFVIFLSFIMTHNVLEKLDVKPTEFVESLSIPLQQISRVIKDGYSLNQKESAMINEVIETEQIRGMYLQHNSDPIKYLIRAKNTEQLIYERKWDYLKLYFSIGFKHPLTYLYAWIDLTKGFWNSGYKFWHWDWDVGIFKNNIGITRNIRSELLSKLSHEYLLLFENMQGLCIFISIGFFTWIDLLMLFIALIRKDKLGVFISLPVLAVVFSLMIAAPFFAEFRYMYAVFCSLPMIIGIVLRPIVDKKSEKLNG